MGPSHIPISSGAEPTVEQSVVLCDVSELLPCQQYHRVTSFCATVARYTQTPAFTIHTTCEFLPRHSQHTLSTHAPKERQHKPPPRGSKCYARSAIMLPAHALHTCSHSQVNMSQTTDMKMCAYFVVLAPDVSPQMLP